MKYVDTEALARLFGKVLPFSIEKFAIHLEECLVRINNDKNHSELAGAADVLLANNRANTTGMWGLYVDYDFDIVANYRPHSDRLGGMFDTGVNIGNHSRKNLAKHNWRVLYNLKIENKFDGTPWLIIFPLQMIMKYYPHKTKGTYFGYAHGIILMDEKDTENDTYAYVGVTKRNWLTRMAEHFREIDSGSNKTFHRAWRSYIGQQDVMLTSELVVANHTFDEIMDWEEEMVDKEMAKGTSLNMIPGGLKGMRFLYQHRLTKSPRISLKEREKAEQEYIRLHPKKGVPNLIVSNLWKDPDWAEKAVCSQSNRLSAEQVRHIRILGAEGLSAEEIFEQVGARNVGQVKRVLSGKTFNAVKSK